MKPTPRDVPGTGDPATASAVDALLADASFRVGGLADLLELLRAAGFDEFRGNPGNTAQMAEWLHARCDWLPASVADDLGAHLAARVPSAPPESHERQHGWLLEIEAVALARAGVVRVPATVPWAAQAGDVLAAHEQRLGAAVAAASLWAHGATAAARRAALGKDIIPWSQLRARTDAERTGGEIHAAIDAWIAGRLGEADARDMEHRVREDGASQRAYAQRIAEMAEVIHATRWNPAWSLDMAFSEEDLDVAAVLLLIPLPHLGSGCQLDARLHRDGVFVREPTKGGIRSQLVAWGATQCTWGDAVTGSVVTRLEVRSPSSLDEAWRAVWAVREIAGGSGGASAVDVALAVATDLRCGALLQGLKDGNKVFREGLDDEDDQATRWVAYAVEARNELGAAAWALRDGRVLSALLDVDAALQPYVGAALLLPKAEYDELIPRSALGELMRGPSDDFVAGVDEALQKLPPVPVTRTPGTRAQAQVQYAAAPDDIAPGSGRFFVLLYSKSSATGSVVELRLRHAPGAGLWATAESLRPVARNAIRTAFEAVARLAPSGLPRYPLEEHTVEVVVDDFDQVIDGDSLALSAAIGFASLWLDVPPPGDLVATGRLDRSDGTVLPVGGIAAKAAATAAWWRGGTVRLLVAPGLGAQVTDAGIVGVEVGTLGEALRHAGLPIEKASYSPPFGSIADRIQLLDRWCADVEAQRLESQSGASVDPWLVLGDRLKWVIRSLADAPAARSRLGRAHALAALAYTHGGDDAAVRKMLGARRPDDETPPFERVLFDTVELGALIDRNQKVECEALCHRLAAELGTLGKEDSQLLRGNALGTVGRALVHGGDPERALQPLHLAVEEHQRWAPHEVGRSRLYLAMALRNAGRARDALTELDRAAVNLRDWTRPFSEPYFSSCTMYWNYERARALLDVGLPVEAMLMAREALKEAEWRGFWPKVGILRTLAWAYGVLGRNADAGACIARIRGARHGVPEGSKAFVETILAEAEGGMRVGGEVY